MSSKKILKMKPVTTQDLLDLAKAITDKQNQIYEKYTGEKLDFRTFMEIEMSWFDCLEETFIDTESK